MMRRLVGTLSRMMLTVMLVTFMSPCLGGHLLATHEGMERAAAAQPSEHARGEAPSEGHDHHDLHSLIGHLLGHLPAFTTAPLTLPGAPGGSSLICEAVRALPHNTALPLFEPPRPSSFA